MRRAFSKGRNVQNIKFGDLLVKLGLVSQTDLNDALQVAPQFGLPIGRTLVLSGRLTEALSVQSMIRERKISFDQAIGMMRSSASKSISLEAHQLRPAPAHKKVRFSEFLVLSGLLTEAEMLNALETSMDKKLSLAQTL